MYIQAGACLACRCCRCINCAVYTYKQKAIRGIEFTYICNIQGVLSSIGKKVAGDGGRREQYYSSSEIIIYPQSKLKGMRL